MYLFIYLFVVNFVIHWNEKALGSHVFPILIPPPTSLPKDWWFWSPCSPKNSQESCLATQFENINSKHPYMNAGKTIALVIETLVCKVMSLFFNTLSRFVITFLPRNKHLWISWLQSPTAVIWSPREENLSLLPVFLLLFAMTWWD